MPANTIIALSLDRMCQQMSPKQASKLACMHAAAWKALLPQPGHHHLSAAAFSAACKGFCLGNYELCDR
jgi:hypothetical protein